MTGAHRVVSNVVLEMISPAANGRLFPCSEGCGDKHAVHAWHGLAQQCTHAAAPLHKLYPCLESPPLRWSLPPGYATAPLKRALHVTPQHGSLREYSMRALPCPHRQVNASTNRKKGGLSHLAMILRFSIRRCTKSTHDRKAFAARVRSMSMAARYIFGRFSLLAATLRTHARHACPT